MTNTRAIRWVALSLASLGFAAGLIALLGWATDLTRLADWDGDGIAMQPNTALAAACAGAALLVGRRRPWLVALLALVCLAIGGATLYEHISGRDLHIDRLLFDKPWGSAGTTSRGRMGPPGAACYMLLGLGLLLLLFKPGGKGRAIAAVLGLAAVSITLLGVTGYVFGADHLYSIPRLTGIALQTAVVIMTLGLALTASVPEHAPAQILWQDSGAGMLARRALPPILILPILLGWLRLVGQQAGFYDTAMGTALLVVFLTVLMCGVLWWGVRAVTVRESVLRAVDQARVREIMERKRAEQALREADARKDEFLAILAHELRGPLAPVRNWLELMKRHRDDRDLLERGRLAMERQLGRMVRLIDDLLDVSRITRNRLELRRRRVELHTILEQAVEACRPMADERRHDLRLEMLPSPIELEADPVRLVQVFDNLVTNACKFTEPGGRIVVEAHREGTDAVVKVRDNGQGLSAEALPHVFDMFTGSGSQDGAPGGLGLGLALVKRLVEMHGATVTVASDGPGQGCEFVVRLPALDAAAAPAPVPAGAPVPSAAPSAEVPVPAAAPSAEVHEAADPSPAPEPASSEESALGGSRVLVVDDSVDSAESLALFLSMSGCETRTAGDGVEAVKLAGEFRPRVILLDIGMPRMNGYEACQAIRAEPWGKEMAIVALTGWGQQEDRKRSAAAGFDRHLVKPVEPAVLTKLLSELLPSAPAR